MEDEPRRVRIVAVGIKGGEYDDMESVSLSTNPKFMAIIERSRASAAQGCISLEDLRRQYGLTPRVTRRPSRRVARHPPSRRRSSR